MATPKFMTLAEIAAKIDVTPRTMQIYNSRAAARRKEGTARKGDLPAPDDRVGRTPVWKISTIDRWVENRPGRGNVSEPVKGSAR